MIRPRFFRAFFWAAPGGALFLWSRERRYTLRRFVR